MSFLYGKVDLGTPEKTDFFSGISESLAQMKLRNENEKAQEKAAIDQASSIPLVSSATMFDSHSQAWTSAAKQLRDNKDEYMKTAEGREQYSQLIEELEFGITEAESMFNTVNPELETNINIARSGQNPEELEARGERDANTLAHYENKLGDLDNGDKYTVSIEGGHFVLSEGQGTKMGVQDPGLMDLMAGKPRLELLPPPDPSKFWIRQKDDSKYQDRDEAVRWVEATTTSTERGKLDMARWYKENLDDLPEEEGREIESMTPEEIASTPGRLNDAAKAYAEASVPEDFSKETPESKAAKKKSESFEKTLSSIVEADGFNTYSFDDEQEVIVNRATLDNTLEEGEEFDDITVQAIRMGDNGPVLITNSGLMPIGSPNEGVYKDLEAQIDRQLGEGSFKQIMQNVVGS